MIFQFGALAFTKVCTLCSKFPQIMTNVCEKKRSPRILQEFFFRIPICEKKPAQIVQLSSSTPIYLSKLKVV